MYGVFDIAFMSHKFYTWIELNWKIDIKCMYSSIHVCGTIYDDEECVFWDKFTTESWSHIECTSFSCQ